jgi:hypothetical protein
MVWTVLLTMLQAPAWADRPTEAGLVVNPLVAVDLAGDRDQEDGFESWIWLSAHARQPGSTGWFLGVDAEHHLRNGEDLEATWAVRAAESGWSGPVGPFHLRAGHLVERWGKLDLLPVVNVLNPMDLRAGPLSSVETTRIPLPMARLQAGSDKVRAELVLIPFAGADRMELQGSDWSVIRPGMLEGLIDEAVDWEGGAGVFLADSVQALQDGMDAMDPSTLRGLTGGLSETGKPEAIISTGEAALRLEFEGPGIDAALMGGALRSHSPATDLDPELRAILKDGEWPALDQISELTSSMAEPLSAEWPRTWFAGTELSTTLGPIGLRAEGGWWSDVVVQTPWLDSAVVPRVAGGVGLDWAHGSTVMLSLEGRYTQHIDAPAPLFLMREAQLDIGAMARVSTLSDRLVLQAASMLVPEHGEYLVRPEVRYRASDQLELGLGCVVLGGPDAPPTTLREAMGYGGGPMSYFGENDSLFAQLRWIQ